MRRALLLPACLLVLGVVAGSASAEGRSITAIGSVNIAVSKSVAQNEAAIRAAVQTARAKAGPAAVAAAKAEALLLATAAGMTLGTLTSVAEIPPSPFGPFAYGADGTFGPGKYCGTIRTPVFKTVKGVRKRTGKFRSRRGCRVPSQVGLSVSVTYSAT